MTKKVLMLQLVDKVSTGNSSIEFMISQMLRNNEVNSNFEKVYHVEFKYYSKNFSIEKVTSTSEEMSLALIIGNMLIDYNNEGCIQYLDN